MVGIKTLEIRNSEALLAAGLRDPITTILADDPANKLGNPFEFYTNERLVMVTTPVHASNFNALIESLNDLDSSFEDRHLLVGLIGPGLTEQHIVTAHRDPTGHIQIFDSKTSDVKKFFGLDFAALSLVRGLFRSLIPAYNKQAVKLNDNLTVDYISLGTQSFFDGVSCGYQSAATMLAVKKLLDKKKDVSREKLLATMADPVGKAKAMHQLPPEKVDTNLTSFIKKAWQDTYMPEASENRPPGFRHYFMGWPEKKVSGVKLYILRVLDLFLIL